MSADEDDLMRQVMGLPPASPGVPGYDDAGQAARRIQCVTLRLAGLSYREIAARLGYADHSSVRRHVLVALAHTERETVAELRVMENERLDRVQAAIWPQVIAGDVAAVLAYLRLSERRARMNGMDRPQEVIVTPGTQDVQQWVADMLTVLDPPTVEEPEDLLGTDDDPDPEP